MAVAVASIFKVRIGSLPGVFKPAHGLMRDRIQEAPLRAGLNGARSFISSFAPRAGLVTPRQTFVRRCHAGNYLAGPMSLPSAESRAQSLAKRRTYKRRAAAARTLSRAR